MIKAAGAGKTLPAGTNLCDVRIFLIVPRPA